MPPKNQALKLREEGYSYSYIHDKTKLSKSTLSYLLRNVPYIPNSFTQKTIGLARAMSGESKASTKLKSVEEAGKKAVKDISSLSKRDLFMLGIGLYIGEGSKTQNIIRVVNGDARVINLFIKWLTNFDYPKNKLAIRIHLYPDSNVGEAESYWALKTGLLPSQFQKACIDKRALKNRKRSGTHLYGTAHVTVRSFGDTRFGVGFSRLIGAWMEKVLELPT
jgi:hypothetical protein